LVATGRVRPPKTGVKNQSLVEIPDCLLVATKHTERGATPNEGDNRFRFCLQCPLEISKSRIHVLIIYKYGPTRHVSCRIIRPECQSNATVLNRFFPFTLVRVHKTPGFECGDQVGRYADSIATILDSPIVLPQGVIGTTPVYQSEAIICIDRERRSVVLDCFSRASCLYIRKAPVIVRHGTVVRTLIVR